MNEKTGELTRGRCRATNLCTYCARLYAIETSEMFLLDAMEHAPTLYVVLTAREHLTRADTRRHLEHVLRAVRRRWPRAEWAVLCELQRRGALHTNHLVKNVPNDQVDQLREVMAEVWCHRVDAEPVAQWAGVIEDEIGVVQYVTLHFMKQAQAPFVGWKGHRSSQTKGYLVRPAAVMRDEARESLRQKRLLHQALTKFDGLPVPPAAIVEQVYEQLEAASAGTTWRLVGGLGDDLDRRRRREARAPFTPDRALLSA